MKRMLAIGLMVLGWTSSAGAEEESPWVVLAVNHPAYRADFTMAMLFGDMHADLGNGRELTSGFEFAFNSVLLQPRYRHRIRQQVSHVTYDRNGARIATLEANPHFLIRVAPNLEVGFGPGIALVDVGGREKDRVLGLQVGVSAHYRVDDFFIGAELRHQFTRTATVGDTEVDADNTRAMLKFGFWL